MDETTIKPSDPCPEITKMTMMGELQEMCAARGLPTKKDYMTLKQSIYDFHNTTEESETARIEQESAPPVDAPPPEPEPAASEQPRGVVMEDVHEHLHGQAVESNGREPQKPSDPSDVLNDKPAHNAIEQRFGLPESMVTDPLAKKNIMEYLNHYLGGPGMMEKKLFGRDSDRMTIREEEVRLHREFCKARGRRNIHLPQFAAARRLYQKGYPVPTVQDVKLDEL